MKTIVELYIYGPAGPAAKEMILCITGNGIAGDRYADGGPRQIQIISAAAQRALRQEAGDCFRRFHANVVLDELNAAELAVGQKLQMDEAEVEITGFKACPFVNCPLRRERIPCALRRGAVTARVARTGKVCVGGPVHLKI